MVQEEIKTAESLRRLLREFSDELFAYPPSLWDEIIGANSGQGEHNPYIMANCNGLAERLVRLGEYTETRLNLGGHEQAVGNQNRRATKVRKAMGYSYPKQDIDF